MNANKALWEKGDFTRIAATMRQSGEALVKSLGIAPPLRVLDLGCGDGTTAVPLARTGADVVGIDIAQNLVVGEDGGEFAVLGREALKGGLPVTEGCHIDLVRAQHLFELRPGDDDKLRRVLGQADRMESFADRVVEVRAQRIHRDLFAHQVLDAFDWAVAQNR